MPVLWGLVFMELMWLVLLFYWCAVHLGHEVDVGGGVGIGSLDVDEVVGVVGMRFLLNKR